MKITRFRYWLLFLLVSIGTSCANIVPPTGGKKDTTPPKVVEVKPGDSLLNTRVSKIELRFNEYMQLKDAKEVQVSPLLPFPPVLSVIGKKVKLTYEDSVLRPNTTYRISFNKSVGDLHEGNAMAPYTYVFSTGSYFDSLRLDGVVIDAATGLPDSGINILLYEASESDTVVVRKKPLYITKSNSGRFTIAGLPDMPFRIFALRDANDNLTYDGEGERIGFIDSIVRPVDSVGTPLTFKVFEELVIDTSGADTTEEGGLGLMKKKRRGASKEDFGYVANVDTSDLTKRVLDVTQPLTVTFNKDVDSLNDTRITLSYDSTITDTIITEVPVTINVAKDTLRDDMLVISAPWRENTVYTLRLLKGFAKDTSGAEALPSKYRFRTKNDDDYAKLTINLAPKYADSGFVLLVKNDKDTVYRKPVTDTTVKLIKLQPGNYNMFLIEDKNGNGKWDTGDLFAKRQPENVIPFTQTMQLKAGWEHSHDFVSEENKPKPKIGSSPKKREGALRK